MRAILHGARAEFLAFVLGFSFSVLAFSTFSVLRSPCRLVDNPEDLMADRYTRAVLTVIAVCLVYLCLVMSRVGTPLSAQGNQQPGAARPGMATGPAEVVIVGWRSAAADIAFPVVVRNTVTTTPSVEGSERVVIAGWEDPKRGVVRLGQDAGIPVDTTGAARPSRVVIAGTEASTPGMWRQRIPVDTAKSPAER
jgi:hypothetical protein